MLEPGSVDGEELVGEDYWQAVRDYVGTLKPLPPEAPREDPEPKPI